jgi:alkylation response protein AidB-like acyl-CoA dehydrogenase
MPGLTHGAAAAGGGLSDAQDIKELFLKKMFTGEWTGTMLLTEPEAGSDVGAVHNTPSKTMTGPIPLPEARSSSLPGEHDLAENIIHPVLARIEGAPAGTKGISLFLVPKFWVNEDGSLGEFNDVVCTGIEDKMGHSRQCHLFPDPGRQRAVPWATLLGEENKGMRAMFLMMNEARLLVGMQGFACASASYINAINYARERVQGRKTCCR